MVFYAAFAELLSVLRTKRQEKLNKEAGFKAFLDLILLPGRRQAIDPLEAVSPRLLTIATATILCKCLISAAAIQEKTNLTLRTAVFGTHFSDVGPVAGITGITSKQFYVLCEKGATSAEPWFSNIEEGRCFCSSPCNRTDFVAYVAFCWALLLSVRCERLFRAKWTRWRRSHSTQQRTSTFFSSEVLRNQCPSQILF